MFLNGPNFAFRLVTFFLLTSYGSLYASKIHEEVKKGNTDAVQRLLMEEPSCIYDLDESQRTPLTLAQSLGHISVIEVLSRVFRTAHAQVQSSFATAQPAPDTNGRRYHSRLFVGEADFSYAVAFLSKHADADIGSHIVATEFELQGRLEQIYPRFSENIMALQQAGVKLSFGIDARSLSSQFPNRNFDRIHFNFPHDRSSARTDSMSRLVHEFFEQCSKLQKDGDKVHFTLPEGVNEDGKKYFYHKWYDLYAASRKHGYSLECKRKFTDAFGEARYPGYRHCQTSTDAVVQAAQNGREYVFAKSALPTQVRVASGSIYGRPVTWMRGVSTDSESSCGYSMGRVSSESVAGSQELGVNIANRERILAISQATTEGAPHRVTPIWTPSDGDCAFHSLGDDRATFLRRVMDVMSNIDDPLHLRFTELFASLGEANQFPTFQAWHAAMQPRQGAPLWVGDFELNLWGLLNNREVRVFTLGNNEFIHRGTGYAFGRQGAPQIWIAHVNADGVENDAPQGQPNHYIALQQDSTISQATVVSSLPASTSSPAEVLVRQVEEIVAYEREDHVSGQFSALTPRQNVRLAGLISKIPACRCPFEEICNFVWDLSDKLGSLRQSRHVPIPEPVLVSQIVSFIVWYLGRYSIALQSL
jgi:hypothetical protein